MSEDKKKITAAILTLSESIEGLYKIIRKDLQFRVEVEQTKIVEDFLPERMRPTTERFKEFEKLLDELENSEIQPLEDNIEGAEPEHKVERVTTDDSGEPLPRPTHKLKRDDNNPPEEYNISN